MLRTNVSWIELVLRPSGARKLWTASMVRASVMGPGKSGGRENARSGRGKGALICDPAHLVQQYPKYWPEPIEHRRLAMTEA